MTRFLLYSHDTYGLGHFRRSSRLAAGLVGADPDNEVLIVTGSPRAQAFPLPDRVDTVKLPCATKDDRGGYRPRKLRGGIDALVRLRAEIIAGTAEAFDPEVIVVDHAPLGMRGELLPLLDRLGRRPTRPGSHRPRLVLGLRDIIDEAGRVEAAWHREGIWDLLDRYDDILVYGDEQVPTTAAELGLAERLRTPVVHTGYLAPVMPEPLTLEPFLLVTPGGGGDGQGLLRRWLDAVEHGATGGLRSVVVTGPLLSSRRRAEVLARADALPSVEIVEFSDRLRTLMVSAVGVVSMAGYNTVAEEMAGGIPSLLVPRCAPRLEQHLRATRLAPLTSFHHHPVEAVDAERVRRFVDHALARPRVEIPVALDGVDRAVRHLIGAPAPVSSPAPSERLAHV